MDDAYTQQYEAFEQRHWWFVARREIICNALDRFAAADARWLDVGCGTGVLLAAYGRVANKIGLELDAASVTRAKAKGLDVRSIDRQDWDFSSLGSFGLVTMCDVIEHVEHDRQAVDAAHAALRPGGMALLTVPALPSLWSDHDVINQHYRRYTRRMLAKLFDPNRWDVLRLTYFSSVLLPLVYAARCTKKMQRRFGAAAAPTHDFKFGPPMIDRALLAAFRLECPWLLRGGSLPLGSSLLLVARRRA